MSNHNLVSVVMATYNGAKYLKEQIESILQQTYPNLELIIVDDGSKDETISIIQSYQQKHDNIFLYTNPENLGVTRTFEKGAQMAKGAFVAFSDQDDVWMLHKIETLISHIGEHDAVYSNSLLVDANGKSLGKSFTSIMNMKTYYSGAPFLLSNSVPGHTILIKKSFLDSILPFPPKMLFDLWIGFNAASNHGIHFVDEVLVHYRQHDTNTIGTRDSKNKKIKQSIAEQFEFKKNELKTLAKASIKDNQTKIILNEMIRHFHRGWSFKRSLFFFKYYNEILISKKKPTYRKKLFCIKMFFKPNF